MIKESIFQKKIKQAYTFGMYDELDKKHRDNKFEIIEKVSAGNPASDSTFDENLGDAPIWFKFPYQIQNLINRSLYVKFMVCGSSMEPDIKAGSIILCSPVVYNEHSIPPSGAFLVIQTDKGYYRFKGKGEKLKFKFKLRKAYKFVPAGQSEDALIEELGDLTQKQKDSIKKKLLETRRFYPNVGLMLSTTQRNSQTSFSFHPLSLVRYQVECVIQGNSFDVKKEKPLGIFQMI